MLEPPMSVAGAVLSPVKDATRRPGSKEAPDLICARLAARQHGLITREQAVSAGLSHRSVDRRLASGRLLAMHRGVYRVPGTPNSWQQRVLAACLWSRGVASYRAAAALWKLDGAERRVVEVTTAGRFRAPDVVVHEVLLADADVTTLGGIPVTKVPRTLLDYAAVATQKALETAISDALRRGVTSPQQLRRIIERTGGRGRRGTAALRSVLQSFGTSPPESVLELRLVRLLRRSGLPQPVIQHTIRDKGAVVARLDLAYPELHLAIEADGYRYHGGPAAWKRDVARRNSLTALGWQVIPLTWDDVSHRPQAVVERIKQGIELAARLAAGHHSFASERRQASSEGGRTRTAGFRA